MLPETHQHTDEEVADLVTFWLNAIIVYLLVALITSCIAARLIGLAIRGSPLEDNVAANLAMSFQSSILSTRQKKCEIDSR